MGCETRPAGRYRQASPRGPGIAPALGLRERARLRQAATVAVGMTCASHAQAETVFWDDGLGTSDGHFLFVNAGELYASRSTAHAAFVFKSASRSCRRGGARAFGRLGQSGGSYV